MKNKKSKISQPPLFYYIFMQFISEINAILKQTKMNRIILTEISYYYK